MKILIFGVILIFTLSYCQYSTQPFKEGKVAYDFYCAPCHGTQAEGLSQLYPGLLDTAYIRSHRSELKNWIRQGISSAQLRHGQTEMPENKKLNDIDIVNILNYCNQQFWHLKEEFQLTQ